MVKIKNPWLGLLSYPEGDILFGRNKEIEELSQKIIYNTQTVLYGRSGIGKSSLLKAGIFPIVRNHNLFPVYIRLTHSADSTSYISQISKSIDHALAELRIITPDQDPLKPYTIISGYKEEVVKTSYSYKEESLWEYFHRHNFFYKVNSQAEPQQIKPLLVFDQFEEIFTSQKDSKKIQLFFSELADLLNNIYPKSLLASAAEEELSEFRAPANSLIKKDFTKRTIKQNYLEESNFHIVISLREDFLSHLERHSQHIPSLKHNRYYLSKLNENQAAEIIMNPYPGLIQHDVAKLIISKLTGVTPDRFELYGNPYLEIEASMLSLFLMELFNKKEPTNPHIESSLVNEFGENIISDFYINAITKLSKSSTEFIENKLLTEEGRRANVFLATAQKNIDEEELKYLKNIRLIHEFSWDNNIRIELMHDVLCPIILQNKAKRKEHEALEIKIKELNSLKRKNRITFAVIAGILVGVLSYYFGFIHNVYHRFSFITKEYGRFVGVEKISVQKASNLNYHFILHKKGYARKNYTSMICVNRYDSLYSNHGIKPYIMSMSNNDSIISYHLKNKIANICQWEFIEDIDGNNIIQERAYDKNKNLVYSLNYSKLQRNDTIANDKNVVLCSFTDMQGLPVGMFLRITYDGHGHDQLIEYFDLNGKKTKNEDGAYMTYYEYDNEGKLLSYSSLNKYGSRMMDKSGKCGLRNIYKGYNLLETVCLDELGKECNNEYGYSKIIYEYDKYERLKYKTFMSFDKPAQSSEEFSHKLELSYNEEGWKITYYDINEEMIDEEEIRYNNSGNPVYYKSRKDTLDCWEIKSFEYSEDNIVKKEQTTHFKGSDTTGIYKYYNADSIKIVKCEGEYFKNNYIQYLIFDRNGKLTNLESYELDGKTPHKSFEYPFVKIRNSEEGEKDNLYYRIKDSTYCSNANRMLVNYEFKEDFPNIRVCHIEKFNYRNETRQYDYFGNTVANLQADMKIHYFVNPRTYDIEDTIKFTKRYNVPINGTCIYEKGAESSKFLDGNGDTINSNKRYKLPKIYNEDKNHYNALCIELYNSNNSLITHGVILQVDNVMFYGEDNYTYENLMETKDIKTITYLNLITMNVEKLNLDNDTYTYWGRYQSSIGKLEHELYMWHYNKYIIQ